jgi:hypothetical protein
MSELQQTPENKRMLLGLFGFESIYAAKKNLGGNAKEVYNYMFDFMNSEIRKETKKLRKERIKKDFAEKLQARIDLRKEKAKAREAKKSVMIKVKRIFQCKELDAKVLKWLSKFNPSNKPFNITVKSGLADIKKTFYFNNTSHFVAWFDKVISRGEGYSKPGSKNYFDDTKSIFDYISIQKIALVSGGCNKHTKTDKHLKTSFYDFELFNPVSRDNNCFFKCLAKILDCVIDIKKYRNMFDLRGKINVDDAVKIIKHHTDKEIEIIDFTAIPELDHEKIYILLKDEHYYVVESFTEIFKKDIKTKRGTIEFDIETRPTEDFHFIAASSTKSFILKDAITCAHVKKYKAKGAENLVFKTDGADSGICSTRKFMDFLNKESLAGRTYNILAHNGGNFDFYFIINILTEQELRDCQIQMRGITIIGINYRGNLFKDSYCFLTFSLNSLSENFKVDNGKITSVTVNGQILTSAQLCFYKPDLTFDQFLKLETEDVQFWEQYVKYCTYDCIALHEIWTKFTACVNDLISSINPFLLRACPLMSSNTIGSHSKKIIKALNAPSKKSDMFGEYKKMLDLFINNDVGKYNFLKKFKRGGISHCNKAGKHLSGITGVDIASQYPASLIYAKIPVGFSNWTETYNDEQHGFYHLKNLHFESDYKFKPLASIKDNGVLEWNTSNVDEIYLDSYTIKYLMDNYDLKTFDVVSGLVSKKDIDAKRLFGLYVDTFYTEKKNQDALKKADAMTYNPALRETIKLYLNSLTGKLVEDPSVHYSLKQIQGFTVDDLKHDGSKEDKKVFNDLDLQEMPKHSFNGIEVVKDLSENTEKINDWIIAGVMVYSYSKRLLFEYIKCLPNNSDDVIHVETDSIYFSTRLKEQFLENVGKYEGDYPCMMGDDLGNLKIEKSTNEGEVAYFLGKKFYDITMNGKDLIKVKGIPQQTIDKYGNKIQLVNTALFESVYVGNEEFRTFQTLKKNLFTQKSNISSHSMTRTIRGNMKYQLYL